MNLFQRYTETEQYVNQALAELQRGNDGDDVYHPLYLAWRSFQNNPSQLKSIVNYGNYGMGFLIFLSYGTVTDIDQQQQLASIAYLFISKAIERDSNNLNYYKNRLLVMLQYQEAFQYTVSSVVNENVGILSFNFHAFDARDAMYKMEYYDLSVNPLLLQVDLFATKKRDLERKISDSFFGNNKSANDIRREGYANHQKILTYLVEKVIDDEDIDF